MLRSEFSIKQKLFRATYSLLVVASYRVRFFVHMRPWGLPSFSCGWIRQSAKTRSGHQPFPSLGGLLVVAIVFTVADSAPAALGHSVVSLEVNSPICENAVFKTAISGPRPAFSWSPSVFPWPIWVKSSLLGHSMASLGADSAKTGVSGLLRMTFGCYSQRAGRINENAGKKRVSKLM